ncbi:MAG: hypothetical protein RO469_10195 [Thermincola sp.]|nr:hypothetical protein [Thermincola sp.]MDT3702565.1 hypothetical protein [Thermincola sp.]
MAKWLTKSRFSSSRIRPFDSGYLVLAAIFVLLGAVIIYTPLYNLASDGSNYFSYLRSAVFDRDLDFHNEFTHFNKAFWETYKPKATVTGHLTNVFSVGPAILWAPFYLAAHLAVLAANLFGVHFKPDGFSGLYILAINLSSLFWGFAGMCLVYRMCKKYYARTLSLIATVMVWLATFMLYYTLYEPYMSHAVSFFATTLFIYFWDATRFSHTLRQRSTRQWVLLGLAAGLMMLVRWQNALLMILPAVESLVLYLHLVRSKSWPRAKTLLTGNLLFLLSAIAAFLPQMAAWKIIYGSFLTIPQGTSFLRWDSPFITELLFSSRHGLYAWSPVVYISTIGWLVFFRREKFLALSGLLAFVLMTYVNSVVSDWWAGWGFGMRRYDGFIILFALGLAAFLQALRVRWNKFSVIAILGIFLFFTGYNLFLMNKYLDRKIHPGGPVSFGRVLGISETKLYKYTGYPFSYPVNLMFSVKHGLPPDRYDILAGGYIDDPYFYGDTIFLGQDKASANISQYEAAASPTEALLGQGWSNRLSYLGREGRAVTGYAELYAPVRTVTDFELEFRCAAPQEPQTDLAILLNGRQLANIAPQADWQIFKIRLARDDLQLGINLLAFRVSSSEAGVYVEYLKFRRLEYMPDWK